MNKQELLQKLNNLKDYYEDEVAHIKADYYLIQYINDKEIKEVYNKIKKWYTQ
jgi:hypothetical protein